MLFSVWISSPASVAVPALSSWAQRSYNSHVSWICIENFGPVHSGIGNMCAHTVRSAHCIRRKRTHRTDPSHSKIVSTPRAIHRRHCPKICRQFCVTPPCVWSYRSVHRIDLKWISNEFRSYFGVECGDRGATRISVTYRRTSQYSFASRCDANLVDGIQPSDDSATDSMKQSQYTAIEWRMPDDPFCSRRTLLN